MSAHRDFVAFYLNNEYLEARGADVFLNLSDFLRKRRSLTGTKIVCAEGDCGACSVLRAFPRPASNSTPQFEVINSCIARVGQLDGSILVTVEGVARDGELDAIQQSMIDCNASQCGFCTPGFVVALADFYNQNKSAGSAQELKNALTGNLCRCTGYTAILDAGLKIEKPAVGELSQRYIHTEKLTRLRELHRRSVHVENRGEVFFAPASVDALRAFRRMHPNSTVLAAGTDLGVQRNKHHKKMPTLLSLHLMDDFYILEKTGERLRVGARITLSELRDKLKNDAPEIANFLNIFASPQIKNFATLVGNVANASPIADTPPFLLALDAQLEIWNPVDDEFREIGIDEFYLGYKKMNLRPGEILWSISFRLPKASERLVLRKISQRRDLDISTVNMALWMKTEGGFDCRLAVGGVAAVPLRLKATEKLLRERGLNAEVIPQALTSAQAEMKPLSDLRGSSAYRRLLVRNLMRDFLQHRNHQKAEEPSYEKEV